MYIKYKRKYKCAESHLDKKYFSYTKNWMHNMLYNMWLKTLNHQIHDTTTVKEIPYRNVTADKSIRGRVK